MTEKTIDYICRIIFNNTAMKTRNHFLFVVFISLFCTSVFAQDESVLEDIDSFSKSGITFSTGINNVVGMLGVGAYFTIQDDLIFEAGAGLGSWGLVGALQLQYYLPASDNLYVRGAFKRSGGGRGLEIEMELSNLSREIVELNLYPVANAQITFGKSWSIQNSHRFFIEGGYSYFFGNHESKYRVVDSSQTLSNTSKDVLAVMIPGGLIFGLGFSIGLD